MHNWFAVMCNNELLTADRLGLLIVDYNAQV